MEKSLLLACLVSMCGVACALTAGDYVVADWTDGTTAKNVVAVNVATGAASTVYGPIASASYGGACANNLTKELYVFYAVSGTDKAGATKTYHIEVVDIKTGSLKSTSPLFQLGTADPVYHFDCDHQWKSMTFITFSGVLEISGTYVVYNVDVASGKVVTYASASGVYLRNKNDRTYDQLTHTWTFNVYNNYYKNKQGSYQVVDLSKPAGTPASSHAWIYDGESTNYVYDLAISGIFYAFNQSCCITNTYTLLRYDSSWQPIAVGPSTAENLFWLDINVVYHAGQMVALVSNGAGMHQYIVVTDLTSAQRHTPLMIGANVKLADGTTASWVTL